MNSAPHPFLQRVATHGLLSALSWCHEYARRSYAEVQRCARAGQRKKLRKAIRDAVGSDVVKISCLQRAGFRSHSARTYLRRAGEMDLAAPFDGEVPWRSIEKNNGGSRIIVGLPLMLKARHKMIASLIEAQSEPPTFIYGVRGRGRDNLILDLMQLLKDGFTAVVRCDIVDCFMSVNPDALTTLPLPRGVIESSLSLENLRLVRQGAQENHAGGPRDALVGNPNGSIGINHSAAQPSGLMQGSPASNIAMTYLLQDLNWPCGNDVRVLVYCDDFFIVGRSFEDCRVVEDALAGYLSRCPFGPLILLRKETSAGGHFDALGYSFSNYGRSDAWNVDLSMKNHDKLEELFDAAIGEDERAGFLHPHLGDALVRERLKSFSAVSDRDAIADRYYWSGVESLFTNYNSMRARVAEMAASRGLRSQAVELALDVVFQREAEVVASLRDWTRKPSK